MPTLLGDILSDTLHHSLDEAATHLLLPQLGPQSSVYQRQGKVGTT